MNGYPEIQRKVLELWHAHSEDIDRGGNMDARKYRILIVDDEKTNIDVLAGLLKDQYRTVAARSGEQALIRANSEAPPDLILLDVMMPDLDGFEVCRRLKANPTTAHIPVIFVTAMGQSGDEAKGFTLGAVDYVSKPINPTILMARLQTHLALAEHSQLLKQQSRLLEIQVKERTCELEQTQEALREAMGNLLIIHVAPGVYWLQIPEAGLYILCGCPSEVVKLLMRKGLNASATKKGVTFETGPNVILLSDLLVQNGGFANLAEFPVLQMLYRQGMILPGHPNNTGVRPMLIGAADQIKAQLGYIHRGNYGLLSKEEIMAAGVDAETAEIMMRIKLKFAFGQIREPSRFLDTLEVDDTPREIRNGAMVQRIGCNRFRFTYRGQSAEIDLNLPPDLPYQSPYPLGHHSIHRHYFAVVHTGSGDGWDPDRPSMSSVLMFQGRIYLIDVVPGVINSLNALGIDISELAGVFHTHAHDDHFAGLPELIRTDRRLHYFATPLVRAAVAKKFAALMSLDEGKFTQFFDVHDLTFDVWNKCNGLDVMPLYAPHPVENNLLLFRALGEEGYRTYAHWADLTALSVLERMSGAGAQDVPPAFVEKVKADYLRPADLKKLDVGGGMIHGVATDFAKDPSRRLILAHLARSLTPEEMSLGSSTAFGAVDVLIAGEQDYRRQRIFCYLKELFPNVADCELRMLINGRILNHNVGTIIRQDGADDGFLDMIIAGEFVYQDARAGICNHLGFGSFMGLHRMFNLSLSETGNYRAVSHGAVLRIPVAMFRIFLEENGLTEWMEGILQKVGFLNHTWLFGEQTSFALLSRIAQVLEVVPVPHGTLLATETEPLLWILKSGRVLMLDAADRVVETLEPGDFLGEHSYLKSINRWRFRTDGACELYKLQWDGVLDAPIIHWKMLEIDQKRARLAA
ncbi:MAG: response regulator [Magnetococcales bacterium]|nr:response regulator [Magnetococcales bacterium]